MIISRDHDPKLPQHAFSPSTLRDVLPSPRSSLTVDMNLKAFFRGKTFRYGIPMLVLIIGGSAGLKEFTTIRYEAMARRTKIDPGLDALFDKTKRKTTLEAHYELHWNPGTAS
uniref:Cytochrome c oxidase assembly protein COX16 homolog, mitochondrial n=1 Tax=Eptatretus burgeri TaxID=7764 RepID=A0A8C4R0B1_EPTBU